MLGGRRSQATEATNLMPDSRVQHFWNDEFIAGEHFREFNFGRAAWDIYFLYASDAIWQEMPEPLISSGYTVYAFRDQLEEDLTDLWQE